MGYLGIRDINSIKEKYQNELDKIKELKSQFDIKSNELEIERVKINEELKTIFKENQDQNQNQNQKIKFIELKEKMILLFSERKLALALEFANAALEIKSVDSICLNTKGSILIQLNQLNDAVEIYEKSIKENPEDHRSKINYLETLYFANRIKEAKNLIENNPSILEDDRLNKLLEFLSIIELYHNNNIEELKKIAQSYVQPENINTKQKLLPWNFDDAQFFASYQKDSKEKTALQNIIWYWNEKITGKQLLSNLGLPIPEK